MYSGLQFGETRNCRYRRVHACKQELQCAAQDHRRHHDWAMDALNRRKDRQNRTKTLHHRARTNTPETRVLDTEQATTKCKPNQQKHPQKKNGITISTNMGVAEQNEGGRKNKNQKGGRAAAQPPWSKQQIPKCPTRCFRRKPANLESETPNIEAKRNSFSTLSRPSIERNPKPKAP